MTKKLTSIVLSVLMLATILVGSTNLVTAAPSSPTDESKVPHYFGPYPNWANSPFTLADAIVTIAPPDGPGTPATATATVGANGAITGITITDPGSGYTADPIVTVTDSAGTNTSATATATYNPTGSVTSITVIDGGAGYTKPQVTITGDGTGAMATAFGAVDSLTLVSAGAGYHMPTVAFDLPDDPNGIQPTAHVVCVEVDCSNPNADGTPGEVTITDIVLDTPGSGYSSAPGVAILDGTQFDPIRPGGTGAQVLATLTIQSVAMDAFGSGYSAATVGFTDAAGVPTADATATATVNSGIVGAITVTNPGSGYVTQGGIKKFQDGLPVLCIPTANLSECDGVANGLGQYIPIAVPDTTTFSVANGFDLDADYYVIALVQTRERMSSSLPDTGTLLREYVQLETPVNASWSKHIPLQTAQLDGSLTPTLMPDGSQAYAVDNPHFLGPVIVANKDKPVRIVFYNLLPTGSGGDLFLPADSTIMGSGMGPMDGMPDPVDEGTVTDGVRNPLCSEYPKSDMCFQDNRATLHLHGGITPWISDGTPHQWITPANENTPWPEGVSVGNVPDMSNVPGVPDCSGETDGCQTFYYTNQQSARFMFYHDHAWGITRLNVYAGEAAGYVITDPTDQKLMAPGGPLADVGIGIPLVIQDRTFVPQDAQLYGDPANGVYGQDPTWDQTRWGGYGNLWYHHVYMPAQNPGDPSGMSAYGRWMYGPWFWPPATPVHGPIANPYYDANCQLDDPNTWQYQTEPFCEPPLIPGTPNVSVGMEQFNDTPIVNGTAYPTTEVDPKAYRFRILNAANDRFWNLQWYVADPSSEADPLIGPTEVALNAAELAAAQTDPNIFPTPDTLVSPPGPSWIQIGTEGGFLPAPVVVPNQPITWITDPTRFDVGNVDKHSLLLAPAERADVIVDFSSYAGQTLILYNDAPAAFPARVASYDYYTGAPDLSPVGAPGILPGYGPNTRTIMQVKVAATRSDGQPIATYNLAALNAAFRHHADGSGVFESGQHPIIVGQAAYNSAYGTNFVSSGWCNSPTNPSARCDGYARISEQGGDLFGFNTLKNPSGTKKTIPLQPKAIHDEMNAVAFDEFGRMTANLGVEAVPATPAGQNVVLYPYVNPQTELIDATNLPKGDIDVTPIGLADDGTQIWKITHNGVDTHPIHWHLYDVQVLNRVTWDNIIIPPDATELGWKDTLRISPLEDTIVALRPIIPTLPFELPNSIRELNPMMPLGSTLGFNNMDANGNPTAAIVNQLVNYGWEYVFHCHILSHEEMDMMRPVSVALPPNAPDGLAYSVTGTGNNTVLTLTWNDNSINETEFVVQRSDNGGPWVDLGSVLSPLDAPNTHGMGAFDDTTFRWDADAHAYRVVARNSIGYGGEFMSLSVESASASIAAIQAPTGLAATLLVGPQVRLAWTDNARNETGFIIERADNGGPFVQIGTAPARNNTGSVAYVDATVVMGATYTYRVAAVNAAGPSAYSNAAGITVSVPADPSNAQATAVRQGSNERVTVTWTDNASNESGFEIQRATDAAFTSGLVTSAVGPNVTTFTTGNIPRVAYYFRVRAVNALGPSAWVNATPFPVLPAP
jgi:FtsP/CotA-like multicopper oxidase with cupredoxin domain